MPTLTERFVADIEGLSDLPSLSPVLAHLIATLDREDASVAEVTAIIRQDPVIAARVLRAANSAAYIGRSSLSSIRAALLRLSLARIRRLALVASLDDPVPERFDLRRGAYPRNAAVSHLAANLVSEEAMDAFEGGSPVRLDNAAVEVLGLSPAAARQITEETRSDAGESAAVLFASPHSGSAKSSVSNESLATSSSMLGRSGAQTRSTPRL